MKVHPLKSLLFFFGLTFLISWGIWIALAITGSSDQLLLWTAGFGPTLAALFLTGWQKGRAGLRSLLNSLLLWRLNPLWYLVSLLGAPLVMLLALGLHVAFGGAWPQFLDPNHMVTSLNQWPLIMIVFFYVLVFTALGEEIGWRGVALPLLQTRFSAVFSSLILGLVWAAWHLPLFWLPGNFHQGLPLSWFMLQVLGSTFLYTWLYNRTHGSLLVMIFFHTASNTAMGLLPILPLDNQSSLQPLWMVLGLLWLCVGLVLWIDRRPMQVFRSAGGSDSPHLAPEKG